MKIVIYGPHRRLGAVVEGAVLGLAQAGSLSPSGDDKPAPFGTLVDFIEAGSEGLYRAQELIERFGSSGREDLLTPLDDTDLHAPFPGRRLAMAGNNFAQHTANAHANFGKPGTAEEIYAKSRAGDAGGFWVVSPPVGPGTPVAMPSRADGVEGLFDYEAELAIVLSDGGKRLNADQWTDRIWGSVLLIDWSLRRHDVFQNQRPFYGHKIFDCSKSIGPWISVGEVDPSECAIETLVNGELRQSFSTRDMIHSFGEILEQVSRDFTFLPGDLLSSGTGPGTAADMSVPGPDGRLPLDLFLKPGDEVEVRAPGLGSLKTSIAQA